jgi:hypothetical protein
MVSWRAKLLRAKLICASGLSSESSTAFDTMPAIVRFGMARRSTRSTSRTCQPDLIADGGRRSS